MSGAEILSRCKDQIRICLMEGTVYDLLRIWDGFKSLLPQREPGDPWSKIWRGFLIDGGKANGVLSLLRWVQKPFKSRDGFKASESLSALRELPVIPDPRSRLHPKDNFEVFEEAYEQWRGANFSLLNFYFCQVLSERSRLPLRFAWIFQGST